LAGSEPQYIGRYRADRVVGSGAFATVWLAEDETLAAPVAIKVLADNWAHDEEVRQRFLEEARILWRADSDHIVRIHNVDELPDGRPYFVMDFADRGTLHERMRERISEGGRYTVDEAVAFSLAIAEGLKVAHALGIVHRDLKPANIMFQSIPSHHADERDEKLILTDFGMAKSVARARGTTIATGTPYYMAPEQTEGRADERSDIYSAGVVLYELLSGRVPYPYDSPGRLFAAQVSEPPARITTLRSDVPPPLEEALRRALASDPAERWPTADAWAGALTAAAKGEVPAPPAPLPGVDPDALRTMAPAEIAAAKAEAAAAAPPPPQPGAPPPPPPAAPPPASPDAHDDRRRKRKRALAIGGPIALVLVGVVAAVLAIVVTGAKTADAKTLTLDPVSALGQQPFTPSLVPTAKTPPSQLNIPPNVTDKLPPQLVSRLNGVTPAKVSGVIAGLLKSLNPLPGATSSLKLPLGGVSLGSSGTTVDGYKPGLYGGTQLLTVCDKKLLISFLVGHADKARAWAATQGISVVDIPSYIARLTDVVLQLDTRVTNHGFNPQDGKAFSIDEVLQAGTAVLVDEFGIPRARCYCGNPLTPPRALAKNVTIKLAPGLKKPWKGFSVKKTVVVKKAKKAPEFGAIDVVTGSTAVYKVPGALPQQTTLTPTLIAPIPTLPTPTETTPTETTPAETAPTETTPTETTPTTPAGGATLAAAGFGDQVGRGDVATPDGTRDAHFRVTIDAGAGATVTDILLQTADDAGKPCCGQFWDTTVNSYWILGVSRDGTRLNPTDRNISDHVTGTVTYDLYANDSGYFKTGQNYIVTVTLSDGRKLTAVAPLGTVPATTPPPPAPTPPAAPPPVSNVTTEGTATASSTYSSQYPVSNGVDGNLSTSWFSVGDKEGPNSTFTWTSSRGAIFVDHIQLYSNAGNSDASIRSGFTFSSVQVSLLHNGQVITSTTVPYPSGHVSVHLGHVGDTVRLLLIHHTNPACGGFGDLVVFGYTPVTTTPSSSGGGAHSAAAAIALTKSVLEQHKSACGMTWTTFTATSTPAGWEVAVNVTTRGNPGTATFTVITGGTVAVPADPLSAEILADCP
jgi:Domain of unknown function (DUF6777)/Protein kinase domain